MDMAYSWGRGLGGKALVCGTTTALLLAAFLYRCMLWRIDLTLGRQAATAGSTLPLLQQYLPAFPQVLFGYVLWLLRSWWRFWMRHPEHDDGPSRLPFDLLLSWSYPYIPRSSVAAHIRKHPIHLPIHLLLYTGISICCHDYYDFELLLQFPCLFRGRLSSNDKQDIFTGFFFEADSKAIWSYSSNPLGSLFSWWRIITLMLEFDEIIVKPTNMCIKYLENPERCAAVHEVTVNKSLA